MEKQLFKLKELREAIKDLEKEKRAIEGELEPLFKEHGCRYESELIKASMSTFKRENFQLKRACEELDKRILKPYITESEITRIIINKR